MLHASNPSFSFQALHRFPDRDLMRATAGTTGSGQVNVCRAGLPSARAGTDGSFGEGQQMAIFRFRYWVIWEICVQVVIIMLGGGNRGDLQFSIRMSHDTLRAFGGGHGSTDPYSNPPLREVTAPQTPTPIPHWGRSRPHWPLPQSATGGGHGSTDTYSNPSLREVTAPLTPTPIRHWGRSRLHWHLLQSATGEGHGSTDPYPNPPLREVTAPLTPTLIRHWSWVSGSRQRCQFPQNVWPIPTKSDNNWLTNFCPNFIAARNIPNPKSRNIPPERARQVLNT